jgi:hypothetical protein
MSACGYAARAINLKTSEGGIPQDDAAYGESEGN